MSFIIQARVLECGKCVRKVGDALDCNGECDKHIKTKSGECQWRVPKSIVTSAVTYTSDGNDTLSTSTDIAIAKECDGTINK